MSLATLIILAAGRSTRMGRPKGLLDAGGVPLLAKQIAEYRSAGGETVVVVTAPGPEPYSGVISEGGAIRAVNEAPEEGQFSSLIVGINKVRELAPRVGGVLVLPVDVPPPCASTWRALMAHRSKHAALPVAPDGRSGHPVWLSPEFCVLLTSIPKASPEARLDRQIRHLPLDLIANVRIDDPQILVDLDTPQDYAAWRN